VAELTLIEAVREALILEMRRDPRVVFLGEDVGLKGGVFRVSQGLQEEFGELRVLDTPLAEIGIAGAAIGAAAAGLRPVAEFQFADYIHPAFDQIVNEAATMRYRSNGEWGCPVVFRAPSGAGVHGALYHSQSPEAFFAHIPGVKVVVPATPADAKGLLTAAIRDDDPVLFLEHKKNYRRNREEVPEGEYLQPIGQARLDRAGTDASVITYGVGVYWSREAADQLADEGVSIEILDLRTVAPLDRAAIAESVRNTGKVLVLHEANQSFGVGAEVSAFIAEELFESLDAPIARLAAADCHIPFAAAQEEQIIPNSSTVAHALKRLVRY
jgi:2-oxoisovalerate dehydrogenase E1 component beta subunit